MAKHETEIAELNKLYQFEWALNDFLVTDEQYPFRLHGEAIRVDGYILGICLRGNLTISVDNQHYEGATNFMLIAKPLQLFRFVHFSKNCRVRFIIFSKRFLIASNIQQHLAEKFQFSHPNALPVIEIEKEEAGEVVHQFEGIWQRFREHDHPYRKEIVGNLLMVLLHDFDAIYQRHFCFIGAGNSRGKELTTRFLELVQRHIQTEHSVEYYARLLHVTPKHLSALVKETTGRTASAYIADMLALEAQTLLHQPNVSIKEAAWKLGFSDQSTFGKFFKRIVGLAPSAYLYQRRRT